MGRGRRRGGKARSPKRSPSQPRHFEYKIGPDILATTGPLFLGYWAVPKALQAQLQDEGKPVPAPVSGAILLDTGAAATCISRRAAESLSLPVTRICAGYGASGKYENPVYLARLGIKISNPVGEQTQLGFEREVQGIKDLHKPWQNAGIKIGGNPIEVVGLAGRDLLRHAKFQYDGVKGVFRMVFELDTFSN